jgi:transposase
MGRPAEVFVRPVSMTEGRRLQRIGRTAKDPVRLRRAIVVLMPAQGQSAPDIAHLLDCPAEYVRGVIHAFNESGFAALDPKGSGGRPKTISEQVRREICLLARCFPRDLGLAFSTVAGDHGEPICRRWRLSTNRASATIRPAQGRRRRVGRPATGEVGPVLPKCLKMSHGPCSAAA